MPRQVMKACNVDAEALRLSLQHYVDEELLTLVIEDGEDAKPTTGFQRVIQRAVLHVQNSGRDEVTGANVLVALFSERESHAVYFLQEQNMTRLDAVSYISHGIAKRPGMTQQKPVRGAEDDEDGDKAVKQGTEALEAYCVNLNEKARSGKVDPLIGREREVERTIQILCRRSKNNPLFVGDPGVGKTAIAEGLARKIVNHEVPDGAERRHDLCTRHGRADRRHALSRRFRGAPEIRRQGTGSHRWRHPLHRRDPHRDRRRRHERRRDGCVEPAQAGACRPGTLRCMGSTTYKEYRQYFEKDRALVRRFQKIDVAEPTVPDTIKILKGIKSYYEEHHKVRYTNDAIKTAVELAAKYINDRKLPDKAIDVIDESRRGPDAAAGIAPQEGDRRQRGGRGRRQDGAHPTQIRVEVRHRGAAQSGNRSQARGLSARTRPSISCPRPSSWRARACARRKSRSAAISSLARPASARPKSPSSSPPSWASNCCAST